MAKRFDIVAILRKKRKGDKLTESEMTYFVQNAADHTINEAQIGAMLMAMAIQGLSTDETSWLTKGMVHSGYVFKWPYEVCDKHSTGGVGDKISIPLAPALAALGVKVPMLSGRGLGFTGGTLDKLESIPGFRVNLSVDELHSCMENCGFFIASPTDNLCSGDKALYSIRDVTATVDCDELIVGSILSKKAAAGVKYMVLDIKVGDAAIYKNVEDAGAFARKMKNNATLLDMDLDCILTEMNNPIGKYVGNGLEIEESILTLRGKGSKDVIELIEVLGGRLLSMSRKAENLEEGRKMIRQVLDNGKALDKFRALLVNQGVDEKTADILCYNDYQTILPVATNTTDILVKQSGWVTNIRALPIAQVVRDLGGGRRKVLEKLDLAAGVVIMTEIGDFVEEGTPWMKVHHNADLTDKLKSDLSDALTVSQKQTTATSRILQII